MRNNLLLVIFYFYVISGLCFSVQAVSIDIIPESGSDTIIVNQDLYNGRIWRDLYVSIQEDQFLFSYDFLPGSVNINGNSFTNMMLRYDILNDEVLTLTNNGFILQLNKEMVDGFSIIHNSKIYKFSNISAGHQGNIDGYVDVRYNGGTALYIKHKKEISKITVGKDYENFIQADRVYIVKDGIFHQVRNTRDFKKILSDKKNEIKAYMKENRILISRKSPDTYVPVLEYYDTLK